MKILIDTGDTDDSIDRAISRSKTALENCNAAAMSAGQSRQVVFSFPGPKVIVSIEKYADSIRVIFKRQP